MPISNAWTPRGVHGGALYIQLLLFAVPLTKLIAVAYPTFFPFSNSKESLPEIKEKQIPKDDGGHGYLRRHNPGNHPASSRRLPQVWLPGGVLDLSVADHFGVYPWDYLCYLCHHQVTEVDFFLWRGGVFFVPHFGVPF